MKRLLIVGALVAASAFTFGLSAQAANPTCPTGDQVNVPTPVGVVCAGGDPTTQSGHVVADGNDSNPGPAAGYIGVDSNEGVVGCSTGNYAGTGDNVITAIPPTGAPTPPDPSNPCTPSAP